jgi:hypothetical protein
LSKSNEAVLNRLQKDIVNAMNRTLSKIKKEQTNLILQDISVRKEKIQNTRSSKYIKAYFNNMSIYIKTYDNNITPTMLPHGKTTRFGVVISINSRTQKLLRGGFVKPRTRKGGIIISSKSIKSDIFGVYSGNFKESKRSYFVSTKMKPSLYDFAAKNIDTLLKKAEQIFTEELKK